MLQFNGVEWKVVSLSEEALLLQAPPEISIDQIHASARLIELTIGEDLLDMVPAYDSIAVFAGISTAALVKKLSGQKLDLQAAASASKCVEIPICYELGLDLESISEHAGCSVDSVISTHLAGTYRSLFVGFTPGFIYADGLEPSLECPRKTSPRTRIEAGSVGIGGTQTGIYSLESPGGWNILGRTPMKLFDPVLSPPMRIEVGATFRFKRITLKEFESWES